MRGEGEENRGSDQMSFFCGENTGRIFASRRAKINRKKMEAEEEKKKGEGILRKEAKS